LRRAINEKYREKRRFSNQGQRECEGILISRALEERKRLAKKKLILML
jgi:hypothetical protein